MLANDDFTARHLSKKLAIHFIGESVNQSEIDSIYSVWKDSKGNLKEVNKEVLNVTARSKGRKFLWPSTWMFQAIRFSGSISYLALKTVMLLFTKRFQVN